MREFGFELALCAHLEREGRLVSRQLGGGVHGRRVLDTVVVEPNDALSERAAITEATIPPAAVESEAGPGEARYWKAVFDCHSERAERAVDAAVERGFFERERRGGRTYVRQTARYPAWVDTITAVENKPDLDRPGALRTQLRIDVSLALADRVVLATASHVTGAHLNRIPDAVGIWRFDPESDEREVVREPTPLPADEPGVELLDRTPARTDVRVVDADAKGRARRRLAERAYGKGWRNFAYPACERCDPDDDGLPHCQWKGRPVDESAECGPDCGGYAAADPPAVDGDRLRAERTPWDPDPDGRASRQAGLDRFG